MLFGNDEILFVISELYAFPPNILFRRLPEFLFSVEEQRQSAGPYMGAGHRLVAGIDDVLRWVVAVQQRNQRFRVLGAVAVCNANSLAFGMFHITVILFRHQFNGFLPAPHLRKAYDFSLRVPLQQRLYLQSCTKTGDNVRYLL